MLRYGIVKNEYAVPQGQISTTASGFAPTAASHTARKKPGTPSTEASGAAWSWAELKQGGAPLRCWPSIFRPSKPHSPIALRTKVRACARTGSQAGQR
jgi:hypothetical protein